MMSSQVISESPLSIVGSTVFGRYPKISVEQTFNMIISDEALVPYACYKKVLSISSTGTGRGTHRSIKGKILLTVVGNKAFIIDMSLIKSYVGSLATTNGDVYIAENNNDEIAITDNVHIYVYNYNDNTFKVSGTDFSIDFTPGYITFQNTRLICASLGTNEWELSASNNALSWPGTSAFVGKLQTKPDQVIGAKRFPGRGNLLFVFGSTITEPWVDQGAAQFPYVRMSSFNVDYGCLNPETIAANEDMIIWLAANEQSGPAIMYSTGSDIKRISTDGIDFKLSQLSHPEISYGFLFRQDGHVIYQITFPHPDDNLSYIYDFNTQKFFTVTDENLNYHIARNVVFFNNTYYFVSFNDGNLYEFSTKYTAFEYEDDEIRDVPRIRITPPLRLKSQRPFIAKTLGFTIENGLPNTITAVSAYNTLSSQRVDLSISRDGGVSFGNVVSQDMNPTGNRKSIMNFQQLGMANDAAYQLRFYGRERFVAFDGTVGVSQ